MYRWVRAVVCVCLYISDVVSSVLSHHLTRVNIQGELNNESRIALRGLFCLLSTYLPYLPVSLLLYLSVRGRKK